MTKFLEIDREPKGVHDEPANLHPTEAEPLSSEALAQPADPALIAGQSLFAGALSTGSAISGAIGMNRKGGKSEFLLISEAVAALEAGMHENFNRRESVKEAKKHYPGASIGFGPQKEDAARIIDNAIIKGELSVVLSNSTEGEVRGDPLQVPPDVLRKMIRTRDGLPDSVIQPTRIFVKDPIQPELRAALSAAKSKLYVRRKEFEAWYEEVRKKGNWPSPTPSTYSSHRLKEDIDQVGALVEISGDNSTA
jgi:hypothetical protein